MMGTASEVHLWWCSVDLPDSSLQEAYGVLSADEIERARRYRFARDRRRFVAARSFLRRTLGQYLSVSPCEIDFVYGPFGKPALLPQRARQPVEFNLSHSGDLAILAVTDGLAVGIDVEEVVPVPDWRAIATRFFSAYEYDALSRVAADTRDVAFYRCWTRKEAFLKALGSGLAHPLDSFDVSLDERRPRLLAVRGNCARPSGWTLYHLCLAHGYVAALAVEGYGARPLWQSPIATASDAELAVKSWAPHSLAHITES